MRDKIFNELIAVVLTEPDMQQLKYKFSEVLDNYDIKKKCTDIVVYEEMPMEIKLYITSRSIEGLAKGSQQLYYDTLTKFFEIVNKPIREVEANDIRKYLYFAQNGKLPNQKRPISNRTLELYRGVIATFFQWCVNNDYLERNPAKSIRKIQYVKTRRAYLTQMELEEVRDNTTNLRDRLIVELLYSTGVRTSELSNIKIGDIDVNEKSINIFNQKGKRYRTVHLNEKAAYYMQQYLPTRCLDNDFLIQGLRSPHGKVSKSAIEDTIKKILGRCNISKHVTPSTFRHTTATQGLNNGMSITNVQMMLGHTDPKTTLIYAEQFAEDVKTSHAKSII